MFEDKGRNRHMGGGGNKWSSKNEDSQRKIKCVRWREAGSSVTLGTNFSSITAGGAAPLLIPLIWAAHPTGVLSNCSLIWACVYTCVRMLFLTYANVSKVWEKWWEEVNDVKLKDNAKQTQAAAATVYLSGSSPEAPANKNIKDTGKLISTPNVWQCLVVWETGVEHTGHRNNI